MIAVPDEIRAAIDAGAALAFSISGGKDGQAMLASCRTLGPGRSVALHADLGRMEWRETPGVVAAQAAAAGMPLVVVRRPKGDLLSRIQDEFARLAGTGRMAWPSSTARYCTAEAKRDQLTKAQRKLGNVIVCCQGIRRQESVARRKRRTVTIERRLTSKRILAAADAGADMATLIAMASRRDRLALNWLPIADMTIDEVWAACGTSAADLAARRAQYRTARDAADDEGMRRALAGFPCHPAYVYGNARVSCALCVLATENDLRVGAEHNPALLAELTAIETASGQTFQPRKSLADVAARLAAAKAARGGSAATASRIG